MDATMEYLMAGDPAIRWQTMRDLLDAPADEVAAERARVAREGWGARLLDEQAADGLWDGGVYRPGWADETRPMYDAWTATHFSMQQLVDFGVDPDDPRVREAVARVRDRVRWDTIDRPYFAGETEPCINGVVLTVGAYFGESDDRAVEPLLAGQLADGGWNCWAEYGAKVASLHSTICVLEGLWDWEQATGGTDAARRARRAGEEYLLERRLFRRRSTGEIIDPRFTMASYPVRWYYDVLRALDYLRRARGDRDERCAEAVELIRKKRHDDGLWLLENTHEGPILFELEQPREGAPSRWVTLRALRVLRWWNA
ncbi:hypothetical protein ET475_12325 [Microbacterium protaetiae]|uniref:Squalene cyclase n=1 Tax=Microbacterium protaetiae TaxID=2509458 RepID=A0A4P6EEE0_9MICO|nr:hypothetical protein [Microbacterium protaetiae]QAY60690.1 hypothetical protein ET475_12325 [Microbacterium protaetiae]